MRRAKSGELAGAIATLPDAAQLATVSLGQIPELLGQLEHLRVVLWQRLVDAVVDDRQRTAADRLVKIDDAAEMLGTTRDWLRRHPELPFRMELSPGQVRFSVQGIEHFIRQHTAHK